MTGVATIPSHVLHVGPISAEYQQKPPTTHEKKVKQKKKNDMSEPSGMQSLQFEENLNISGMISPEKDEFFWWNSLLTLRPLNGDTREIPWIVASHQHIKERRCFLPMLDFTVSVGSCLSVFVSIDTKFHLDVWSYSMVSLKKHQPHISFRAFQELVPMTNYVDPVAANGAVEKWLVQVPRLNCCHLCWVDIPKWQSNYDFDEQLKQLSGKLGKHSFFYLNFAIILSSWTWTFCFCPHYGSSMTHHGLTTWSHGFVRNPNPSLFRNFQLPRWRMLC